MNTIRSGVFDRPKLEPAAPLMVSLEALVLSRPDDPLLLKTYTELIEPNFAFEDRDDFIAIQDFTRGSGCSIYRAIAVVDRATLVGATLYGVVAFDGFCFMVGEYTAVAPEYRFRGLGSYLSNLREREAHVSAGSLGFEKPDFYVITISERNTVPFCGQEPRLGRDRTMWRRLGYCGIEFPFVQLPLHEGVRSGTKMRLAIKDSDQRFRRTRLQSAEMRAIIRGCNHFRAGTEPNEAFPEYLSMLARLDANGVMKMMDEPRAANVTACCTSASPAG